MRLSGREHEGAGSIPAVAVSWSWLLDEIAKRIRAEGSAEMPEVPKADNAGARRLIARIRERQRKMRLEAQFDRAYRSALEKVLLEETMQREIKTHEAQGEKSGVAILDIAEQGSPDAFHSYKVVLKEEGKPDTTLADINFQNGPVKEVGVNGVQDAHLLAILVDRYDSWVKLGGENPDHDNRHALHHLQCALKHIHDRTTKRMARDVEGTSVK